ncbi:MAG: hypothetical protein KDA24_20640 [Deltaproteobacteria bacterium]|nr:hypothetical protein [Deltaproteobacteria bacterium]
MKSSRLWLWGLTACGVLVAMVRNRGTVDFDEDETRYFELGESLARHVYALDVEQVFLHLVGTYRPPLLVISDALALLLMTPSPHGLSVVRVAWLGLLLWAVSGIAGDVARRSGMGSWDAERSRVIAMVLAATSPAVLLLAGSLMSEVPLAALFACSVRLLLALDESPSDRNAAALGAVVGAAMLVKWTLPVSLAVPALVAVLASSQRAAMLRLGSFAVAVAAAVAGPWYLLAGGRVATFVFSVGQGEGAQAFGAAERAPLGDALYYAGVLGWELLVVPLAVLAAAGSLTALRRGLRGRAVLFASVLGPALLFSLLANKEIRYLLPALGVWCALGGVGLASLSAGTAGRSWSRFLQPAPLALLGLLGVAAAHLSGDDEPFPYRRATPDDLPVETIDAVVQALNPGGIRRAAVMSPEPWLWTPLWAQGVEANAWTRWQAAWCAPHLMDEAAFFLVASPQGTMEHCATDGQNSLAKFEELRAELEPIQRWSGGGKDLVLLVHRERLLSRPDATVPGPLLSRPDATEPDR